MRNNFKKLWTPSLQHFFGELFKQIIFSKKCLVVFQKKKKVSGLNSTTIIRWWYTNASSSKIWDRR